MTTRDTRPLQAPFFLPQDRIGPDSADLPPNGTAIDLNNHTINAPGSARTLSFLSSNVMNTLSGRKPSIKNSNPSSFPRSNTNGTIRSVPADTHIDTSRTSNEAARRSPSPATQHDMPHSTKSLPQLPIPISHSQPPLTHQNNLVVSNGLVRKISAEYGPTRPLSNNSNPSTINTQNGHSNNAEDNSAGPGGPPQWSSAVGRANLGKSGQIINKLMSDKDMLQRDLKIEQLRSEESRNAVKMVEMKMEQQVADYERKLHDAVILKSTLKRKERQLNELKDEAQKEKRRADQAVERERNWREELEKVQDECKRKVDEAQSYAALMEGRNNALTSHWKEQGAEVDRTVGKLSTDIENIVLERRNDDRRITMLQGLNEQQAELLSSLALEKEQIQKAFEAYKSEQEESLRDIKKRAVEQELRNEEMILQSQKVLGQLKWALNVKNTVREAQ